MKHILVLGVTALCAAAISAAPLGPTFTYQGRLDDGGQPASGTYDFSFILHDDPTNDVAIGNIVYSFGVPVTNGLFTVPINENNEFGPSAFNGSARWLEIFTRTNKNALGNNFVPLSPRQQMTAAPNALFAQTAFAALNAANVTDGAITSSKLAPGAVTWGTLNNVPPGFADGVDNDTKYAAGPGLTLSGASNQFSVDFAGGGNASSAARSDHGHFGGNWNGSSSGYGLTVMNNSASGNGLYSQQGTGSGKSAPLNYKAALWGESSHGDAVYGASGSTGGAGVYGYATAASGANYGVYGQSDSPAGVGVLARGSGPSGTALKISNGALRIAGAGTNSPTPAFVHVVTPANHFTNSVFGFTFEWTVIDNPYCNNDPNALVFVMPRDWPLGLYNLSYDDGSGAYANNRWVIVNFDQSFPLAIGNRYNVLVVKP